MPDRRTFLRVLPLAAALPVAGCEIESINYFPPHPANVRLLNLIVGAPPVTVTVNGNAAYANIPFQGITGYQSYENDVTQFAVTIPGSTTPILQFTYSLAGNQSYSLVLGGSLGQPSAALLPDGSGANGNVQISVFNGAINTNSTAIDIYVTAPGVDITTVNPNYFSVGYVVQSRILNFPGGTYQVRVTPAGVKGIIYDSGAQVFPGNSAVAIVVYSKGSGDLVNAVLLQAGGPATIVDSSTTRVKTINAASQSGPVNQSLSGAVVVTNLAYPTASTYNEVPAGTQTIAFEATASPGAVIASVAPNLGAASDQSVFLTGLPGALQAIVLSDLNVPPLGGNVRVRYVNTATNVNPLNVLVDGTVQLGALASPTASSYVEFAAGTYTFTFNDTVSGATVLSLPNVALTAGQTSSIYVTGTAGQLAGLVTQDD